MGAASAGNLGSTDSSRRRRNFGEVARHPPATLAAIAHFDDTILSQIAFFDK